MNQDQANVRAIRASGNVTTESLCLPCIGRLAGATPSGAIAVRIGTGEPKPARLMVGLHRSELNQPAMQDREVLVMFERGDPEKPIILGMLADPLEELIAMSDADEPKEIILDGKRVTLEAHDEILLKCGEGSISLRKDGKIIIKGTHLLSRATGPNRIKGGSVQIN